MFSKKLCNKIDRLRYVGYFTLKQAEEKKMRLVTGREGKLCLYWLVDETDGIIADAKFQAFGPIALIGAAEIASELVLRKNYDQASRLSAELIDRHVRDRKEVSAFPSECSAYFNQALMAIDKAVEQCVDIPFETNYTTTPIEGDFSEIVGGIPGWQDFSLEKKTAIIEEVIDKEIRPYIELDAGGVQLISLTSQNELTISYQGACTSCHASTGSTLNAIQNILARRVYPDLVVIPLI